MADPVSSTSASKTVQKRKAKREAAATAVTDPDTAPLSIGEGAAGEPKVNGEAQESTYVKDVQRNVRNVTKKLAAMQKVDSVVAENPGVSLDDLVSTKRINADQKAQALKKPSLQAQLAQYEEQISSYKKVEQEIHAQSQKERERLENAHQVELESLRATLAQDAKVEAANTTRSNLLTLSTFLRAAAARRQLEDDTSEESKAFEGLLLLLYGGDTAAVDAAEKLVTGSNDGVMSTEGATLSVPYARVKELSGEVAPIGAEELPISSDDQPINGIGSVAPPTTDPTIAHAGLTEQASEMRLGGSDSKSQPEQALLRGRAANAAASTSWDNATSAASADGMADSWVSVPRPADELEKETSPATQTNANNWNSNVESNADSGETATQDMAWADEPPPPPADDGFHEVHRNRGRARGGPGYDGRGAGRGRGRGGGGFRGDFRGGRGDGRGGRGRGRGRGD